MGLNTYKVPLSDPVPTLENHTPISAIRLMLCIFNGTTHFPKLTNIRTSIQTHTPHTYNLPACQLATTLRSSLVSHAALQHQQSHWQQATPQPEAVAHGKGAGLLHVATVAEVLLI